MNLAKYGYVLPVQTSTGEVIDIAGYTECFQQWVDEEKKEDSYYYVHLPNDQIVPIGRCAASFSDWNVFLAKTFTKPIDQERAFAKIESRYHCTPKSKVIKEINGVYLCAYLCEDGTVYDCAGYLVTNEANYRDNQDIVSWNYDTVFALSNEGKLRLVSYNGSSENLRKMKPIITQIESYSDVVKAVSGEHGWELAFLLKNGTVVFVRWDIQEYTDWEDVRDIVISRHGVIALTSQGKFLYPEGQFFETRWRSFEIIRRETTGKGYFYPAVEEHVDFSNFSHVYHTENYIYGFSNVGKAAVLDLCEKQHVITLPFCVKRMLFYRQITKEKNEIDRFYFVGENGTSYYWSSWKKEPCITELPGIKGLSAITRGGYVTDTGDFFRTSGDYIRTHSTIPEIQGVQEVYECPDYFAFLTKTGELIIFTNKFSQYKQQRAHNVKKACFTESHIVLLYRDGHVGYIGRNTGRCCSGLEEITEAVDIAASDRSTTIIRANGEAITLPKRKS